MIVDELDAVSVFQDVDIMHCPPYAVPAVRRRKLSNFSLASMSAEQKRE